MREILFRGFWKNNGALVKGDLTIRAHNLPYIRDRKSGKQYIVEPDSVEEFTGRYDKNGIEIFENDLVKIPNGTKYQIVWDAEDCRYLMEGFDGMKYAKYALGFASSQLEVIGNIHEKIEAVKP